MAIGAHGVHGPSAPKNAMGEGHADTDNAITLLLDLVVKCAKDRTSGNAYATWIPVVR